QFEPKVLVPPVDKAARRATSVHPAITPSARVAPSQRTKIASARTAARALRLETAAALRQVSNPERRFIQIIQSLAPSNFHNVRWMPRTDIKWALFVAVLVTFFIKLAQASGFFIPDFIFYTDDARHFILLRAGSQSGHFGCG